jgi:hypothetical protein
MTTFVQCGNESHLRQGQSRCNEAGGFDLRLLGPKDHPSNKVNFMFLLAEASLTYEQMAVHLFC